MSENNGEFVSLDGLFAAEKKVTYKGNRYIVREMSEESKLRYEARRLKNSVIEDGKILLNSENFVGIEPYVVSLCLFKIEADGTETPVDDSTIRSWGFKAVEKVYDLAAEINDIDNPKTVEGLRKMRERIDEQIQRLEAVQKKEFDPKNSPSDTMPTSTLPKN